ncbi:MAG TPA: NUDIX hydrolase [Candidatus Paceibacterota bacterium]
MNEKLHSNDFPDCFYRVSIKGLCVRDGKVLLAKESAELSGMWEMPGGGLDFGEDVKEGLKREIEEEMGLSIRRISDKPIYVWSYKQHGHKLEWYYCLVVIYQIELENLDFTPSRECTEIRFFSKEELQTLPLYGKAQPLQGVFNPKDFEADF